MLRTKVRYCSLVSESVVICQLTLKMAEEIDFENQRISNFKGLVTLTFDRVIRHTVVHHSSTSTYIPNLIGIGKTFFGRMYGRTYICTYGRTFEPHIDIIRLTLRSRPRKEKTNPMTNKLAAIKKKTHRKPKPKCKPTGPSSPV